MDVEIRKLKHEDLDKFKELIRLFENVFEMKNFTMPDDDYLQQMLDKETFFVFVASLGNRVVGGLTSYTLHQYYSKQPLVYIYDLAVKTGFQRRGIGRKLIAGITDYCKQTGMEEVFVQADEIDKHAVDFYRSTGATPEKVIHFYYPLNPVKT